MSGADAYFTSYYNVKIHVIGHSGFANITFLCAHHTGYLFGVAPYLVNEIIINMFIHNFTQGRPKYNKGVVNNDSGSYQRGPIISALISLSHQQREGNAYKSS